MAVEAAIATADRILCDPLRRSVHDALTPFIAGDPFLKLGSRTVLVGEVVDVRFDDIELLVAPFTPYLGFGLAAGHTSHVVVTMPHLSSRSIRLAKGVVITCAGSTASESSEHVCFHEDAVITFRAEFDRCMPWNFMHAFAGGFGGWTHATEFIGSKLDSFCIGQEFEVDANEQVMQIWSARRGLMPHKCPIPWTTKWPTSRFVGIHGPVSDWSMLNTVRVQANMGMTMSPPCQSWSRGGKHLGLADPNGWSFIEAVELAIVLQPVCIVGECSDDIVEHPHFQLLETIIHAAGFKKIWMQITPMHAIADHSRTRWLAVWCRADVGAQFIGFNFPLKSIPRTPWDDQINKFRVPSIWRSQLVLSPSEAAIYDDPQLLPNGTQRNLRLSEKQSTLWARVPASSKPLPTLCATYTVQHQLGSAHVAQRGLYTFLRHSSEGFEFFDPGLFCALFGTITDLVLPTKVAEAFRVLDNAISVPHALLALGIALHAVGQINVDPLHIIRKAWPLRLHADNAVLFEHQGAVHLIRAEHVTSWISPISMPRAAKGPFLRCTGSIGNHDFNLVFSAEVIIGDCFPRCWNGPPELLAQIYFRADDTRASMTLPVGLLASRSKEWDIVLAAKVVGKCTFETEPEIEIISISPTAPCRVLEPDIHITETTQFEDIIQSNWFLQLSDLCGGFCQCNDTQQATLIVLHPQHGFHFQCWGSAQQIEKAGIAVRDIMRGNLIQMQHEISSPATAVWCVICCQQVEHLRVVQLPTGAFHLVQCGDPEGASQSFVQRCDHFAMSQPHTGRWEVHEIQVLTPKSDVLAGGHHEAAGPPARLSQGATFNQRAEFMCNTQGWLATDEMLAMTQQLQWSQRQYLFTPPVLWDPAQADFEDEGQEIQISNNAVNVLPILVGNHWAACEIHRHADQSRVVMIQMPDHLVTRATFMIARLLDIAPHRIEVQTEQTAFVPHLCGWALLQRWYTALGLQDDIPDQSRQYHLPDQYSQTVDMCLQCSVEDWRENGMPHPMGYIAHRLRKNFLWFLARRESLGQPVRQVPLQVAIPQPTQRVNTAQSVATIQQQSFDLLHRIRVRLALFSQFPGWAISDEIDYALEILRWQHPNTLFCAPASWNHHTRELRFMNNLQPEYRSYRHISWFIAMHNHWIHVELSQYHQGIALYVTTPPAWRHLIQPVIEVLVRGAEVDPTILHVHFLEQWDPEGMCGFAILFRMLRRAQINIGPVGDPQIRLLVTHDLAEQIQDVRNEATFEWLQAGVPPEFLNFAINIRNWFLVRILEGRFPAHAVAAGAVSSDQEMQDAQRAMPAAQATKPSQPSVQPPDPWAGGDPWSKKIPRPAQSKWEDLTIQDPLPFVDKDDKALSQTHRLQLGPSRGGIVLSTKSHLAEIAKIGSTDNLAVLIPASDSASLNHITKKLEGPFEVALVDSSAKISYKRLVHMIVFTGSVRFQLPKAKCKITTPSIAELVLEIDSRVVPRAEFDKLKEAPVNSFKDLIQEICGQLDSSVVIYGYRIAQHPGASKHDQQMQCVLKAPSLTRKALLEASGTTVLLVRDYMEKGKGPDDTTVLPRFWSVSPQELQRMRIAVLGTPGLAGIVVTRRGLAVRVWIDSIKAARSALMAGDSRLVPENMHVIPRHTIELSGWPAATDAAHVVKSTIAAISTPVLPLRTYRAAGVHTWVVAVDSVPSAKTFTLEINNEVVEILLQEALLAQHGRQVSKGKAKGKGKNHHPGGELPGAWPIKPASVPSASTDESRLDRLEDRFQKLEARQSTFESRVDSKFDTIQDSLRQLLANTNPRLREPTGESPPPKIPKSS